MDGCYSYLICTGRKRVFIRLSGDGLAIWSQPFIGRCRWWWCRFWFPLQSGPRHPSFARHRNNSLTFICLNQRWMMNWTKKYPYISIQFRFIFQVQWLIDNYETAEGVSLPRSTLYAHYLRHCNEHKLEPVNAANWSVPFRLFGSENQTTGHQATR